VPPPRGRVWIARILFRDEVARKIRMKHGVSPWEVEEACLFGAHRQARWHDHPTYGRRLLVRGTTYAGSEILAYLKPVDMTDGTWECRTARRM